MENVISRNCDLFRVIATLFLVIMTFYFTKGQYLRIATLFHVIATFSSSLPLYLTTFL